MEKSDLYLQEEEKEEKKKGRKRAEPLASQSPLDFGFTLASIHSEWKRHGGQVWVRVRRTTLEKPGWSPQPGSEDMKTS